ncbi:hypothetical protein ODS27_02005 [Escherichia coli]|nr:hypothetical protein [Escherichia coli]MED9215042.1 hypothetical protein [Escherichia coli]
MSIKELDEIDPDLFQAIEIYKTRMNTKAEKMQMLYHSHSCYMMAMYSQGLSKDYKKDLSYKDFDFMDMLDDSLTTKERKEKRLADKEKKQNTDLKSLGEVIKSMATNKGKGKGKGNGKK